MDTVPASIGSNRSASVCLRKIDNGYEVTYGKEVKKLNKDGNNFLYDYINETYAFATLDEAADKVKELGARD